MIGHAQIIINGLGTMDARQLITFFDRHFIDNMRGFSGVVAADVKEVTNIQLLKSRQHLGADLWRWLQAHGLQRSRWRARDDF